MLNYITVKRSSDSLRYKYQQITKIGTKIGINKNCILRKMSLKFQNLIFKFFLQNTLPEQAKKAEEEADSMERAVQVKFQIVWWYHLEK